MRSTPRPDAAPINPSRLMPIFGGGGEPCTLCQKRVYPAERAKTNAGNIFHKECLRCTKCKKLLTMSSCCEDSGVRH